VFLGALTVTAHYPSYLRLDDEPVQLSGDTILVPAGTRFETKGEATAPLASAGWKIGDGWINVGPHSEVKGRNTQPGRILVNIESSDVKGDFAKLTAAGAKVVREPYRMDGWPPNTWVATLADPDDNYFQLVTPT